MGTEGKEKVFSGKYNKKIPLENVWDRERLVESSLSYIRKMAELCRKNGVEFNIVIFLMQNALSRSRAIWRIWMHF